LGEAMMDLLDWAERQSKFDPPKASGITGPSLETSQRAAESIQPSADSLRGIVFAFLRGRGEEGATDEEIQTGLAMNPSTQRPRRGELLKAGLIEATERTRKTRSGRNAIVWIVSKLN
jgi:hypothetical protein